MKTAFIESHIRCPRCSKRLVCDLGPDDDGAITIGHDCLNCKWHEEAPRSVADARRRSDVPQVRAVHESLAEALRRQRLEGVVVPLRVDTNPWAEEEW